MFDPSTYYDEQLRRLQGGTNQQRQTQFPSMSPDETEGALSSLGHKVLGGMGYVGGILDKSFGGRAVRGLLGGKPRELMSILPGSDTFGLTDESDIVHGRDLLENAGVIGKGVPGSGLDFGDVAGFGLDVALDPSVYFGNWIGKLGQATGATAKAAQLASKVPGVAKTYEALRPLGRGLTAMFDPAVKNTIGEASQPAMRAMSEALPAQTYAAEKAAQDAFEGLRGAGEATPHPSTIAAFANAMEGNPPLAPWIQGPPAPGTVPIQGPAQQSRALLDASHKARADLGMLAPYTQNYLPTGKTDVLAGGPTGFSRGGQALDPALRSQIGRNVELFGDLPRYGWVNPLTANMDQALPGFAGQTPLQRADSILSNVLHPWEDAKQALGYGQTQNLYSQAERTAHAALDAKAAAGVGLTPAEEAARAGYQASHYKLSQQANRMADWLASPELQEYARQGLPLFGTSPLQNISDTLKSGVAGVEKTKALYGLLQSAATAPGSDTVPITKVLSDMGHLDTSAAQNALAQIMGLGIGPTVPGQVAKTPLEHLQGLHVRQEIAKDVGRAINGFTTPTALEPLLNAVDSFTGLYRGLNASLLRPARYMRNLVQQMWGMEVGGHADPRFSALDPRKYTVPMQEGTQLLRAGPDYVLPDAHTIPYLAGRNLTPEQATRELQKDFYATGMAGPGRTTGRIESEMPGALHAAQAQYNLPGTAQPGIGEILKGAIPQSWEEAKPWNVQGFGGRQSTQFAPVAQGREMDALIDDATRGGSGMALLRQGMTPVEAAKEVNRIHYDYSGSMSDFEKAFPRRVFPFYAWLKNNVPAQLKLLWEQPGGKTAQAIRAVGDAQQGQGFLPDDIREGIGAPVGAQEGGVQRFLTSLGLPFEDFGDLVTGRGGAGNVGGTLSNLGSQLNPLLKAPIELATDRSLMSGRNLTDQHGPTGNVLMDQALSNAPGASVAHSLESLLNPNQGMVPKLTNFLTPARLRDVDLEKSRGPAGRELITDLLRQEPGVKVFEQPYVPPDQMQNLSPEATMLLQVQRSLEQQAQQKARENKKIGVRRQP